MNPPEIKIEKASANDIESLIDIWQAIDDSSNQNHPFGGDSSTKKEHTHQLLIHTIQSPNAVIFLARFDQGKIVGTISGHVFEKPGVRLNPVGVIYSLWVDPENRRQGIGQQLLTTLESFLQEKGAQAIQVGWSVGNDNAAEWWQRRGYCPYEVIASKILE